MHSTARLAQKKNLLLAFDAFGTLYKPRYPIAHTYAAAAKKHGIDCMGNPNDPREIEPIDASFKRAYMNELLRNPIYGKATGMGAEKWWSNVIRNTISPYVELGKEVPQDLVTDLMTIFSTKEGYDMYPDVIPFFKMLKNRSPKKGRPWSWKWDKTVVGIITNSDDRVLSILKSFGLKVGPRRVGTSAQRSTEASLDEDISFVVLSYDLGFEKPDRKIFDAATDMLRDTLAENNEGLSVDDFKKLYVGDSVLHDYLAAKAAGWDTILIDRERNMEPLEKGKLITKIQFGGGSGLKEDSLLMIKSFEGLNKWLPKSQHKKTK